MKGKRRGRAIAPNCLLAALEKEMATHSSVLAWRIPGMVVEPGGLPSMGLHRVGHEGSCIWHHLGLCGSCPTSFPLKSLPRPSRKERGGSRAWPALTTVPVPVLFWP